MQTSAYLIIAHGSKESQATDAFWSFIEQFRAGFPGKRVEGAFLEISKPSIPEGIEKCIAGGAREIFVIPMLLFPGRHVKQDIPAFIADAKDKHPEVDFHYTGPLSDHPALVQLVEENARTSKKKGAFRA
jgi:sirohydrochlorin ferrochelatase